MVSANTDPELSQWLRWASESGNTPMFVRKVAEAALIACMPDYELLRPVVLELKRRYFEGLIRRSPRLRVYGREDSSSSDCRWRGFL
jgi:hypothetical protein